MSKRYSGLVGGIAGFTLAFALSAIAASAPQSLPEREIAPAVPSAASLIRFYPTPIASSPAGVDDHEVWLAKIQGLMADAPPMLQQSLLMSRTAKEFVSNLALLEQMQEGSLKRSGLDLRLATRDGVRTKVLGDQNNLVYKGLTPCRIMDSRNATIGSGVQGPLMGGNLYQVPGVLAAANTYQQFGGTNSNCGLSTPPGSNIKAVAIVMTILAPNFDAYLGASDVNNLATVLGTVALNYTHAQGLSTLYVVPQDVANTIYFAMPAQLVANIIFDVVGYYTVSDATALNCVQTFSSDAPLSGASFDLQMPACASGYSLTGAGCWTAGFQDVTWAINGLYKINASDTLAAHCAGKNVSAFQIPITGTAQCCRVAGK